jgi:HEAT repeat protein
LYTVILVGISLFWVDLKAGRTVDPSDPDTQVELSQVVTSLDGMGENRRGIYAEMEQVPRYGAAGTDALVELATHSNPIIREFSIQLLGQQHYTAGEDIYLGALNDSIKRVRSSAILASGILSSERAADSLIRLLVAPEYPNNKFHIYGSLGSIGQPKAIPYLVEGLEGEEWFNQIAALDAILTIDPEKGVMFAIRELQDEDVHVRQNAVTKCILSEDPRVVEPLKAMYHDEDFEVRFYARQGVKRITKHAATGQQGIP